MIDADYFKTQIVRQFQELGEATAELHLTTGTVYRIRQVSQVHPGYVLLEIFPPGGISQKSKAKRRMDSSGEVLFDRVAVPYERIAHVLLTITQARHRAQIGSETSQAGSAEHDPAAR
jgi:hypothetical protein